MGHTARSRWGLKFRVQCYFSLAHQTPVDIGLGCGGNDGGSGVRGAGDPIGGWRRNNGRGILRRGGSCALGAATRSKGFGVSPFPLTGCFMKTVRTNQFENRLKYKTLDFIELVTEL